MWQGFQQKLATAGASAAVSHQATGYLAMLGNKYLKNETLKMVASIAYCHRDSLW